MLSDMGVDSSRVTARLLDAGCDEIVGWFGQRDTFAALMNATTVFIAGNPNQRAASAISK
jgi:hypothetical protein